jgi:hypothetical protein
MPGRYIVNIRSDGTYESTSPYEDFTSAGWTEADPGADISVGSYTISYTDLETRNNAMDAYVYKDYGASNFGDFTHETELYITSMDASAGTIVWGLTNEPGEAFGDWTEGICIRVFLGAPSIAATYKDDASINWKTISVSTQYYLRIVRSGATITLTVYDDEDRTNLIVTSTAPDAPTTAYRYLYAIATEANSGDTGYEATGSVGNFNLSP